MFSESVNIGRGRATIVHGQTGSGSCCRRISYHRHSQLQGERLDRKTKKKNDDDDEFGFVCEPSPESVRFIS